MLTVIGAVLVLFACAAFVMVKLSQQCKRIEAARDFRLVFSRLAEKMEFTQQPLPQLFGEVSQEDIGETKEFLEEAVRLLTDGKNRTLGEIWSELLRTYAKKYNLSPATVRVLKSIGGHLGQMAQHAEIEALAVAGKELDEEICRLEAEFSQNEKLLKSAGVLVGILIVILFI